MAELLHEIWHDAETRSFEMGVVSKEADQQRARMFPSSVLVHSFKASSYYEAAQKNYDWHGWGQFKREPNWDDHFHTDEEDETQKQYLETRWR